MSYYFEIPEGRLESENYYSEPFSTWIEKDFDADFFLAEVLPALEQGKVAIATHSWGELEVSILYWDSSVFDDKDITEEQFISQFKTEDVHRRIQALKYRRVEE